MRQGMARPIKLNLGEGGEALRSGSQKSEDPVTKIERSGKERGATRDGSERKRKVERGVTGNEDRRRGKDSG